MIYHIHNGEITWYSSKEALPDTGYATTDFSKALRESLSQGCRIPSTLSEDQPDPRRHACLRWIANFKRKKNGK
jgi:hypothetical protein